MTRNCKACMWAVKACMWAVEAGLWAVDCTLDGRSTKSRPLYPFNNAFSQVEEWERYQEEQEAYNANLNPKP